jgi:glucose-6-phosphate 1-dehydrogenase
MEAYERLLGDAMLGDATLFARQDVVEAAWAIVDPVIHVPSPMYEYEARRGRGRLEYAVGQGHPSSRF